MMLGQYALERRWPDLLRDVRRTQEEMNRLFGGFRLATSSEFPPVNVWAGPDGAVVAAEVPGVSPDELDITVHQDTVTLRGKREPEVMGDDMVAHRRERPHGSFTRTIVLPFRVDADKVAARFDRGLLTLELPRPAADKPRQVKVARA
jgi:HSP20 family protein